MEVSGQLHDPAALPHERAPCTHWIGGWVGPRPQSRSGRGGEEKNSQPLPGIEAYRSDRPANNLVAIPTELSRL
jgi:hypothetical protein